MLEIRHLMKGHLLEILTLFFSPQALLNLVFSAFSVLFCYYLLDMSSKISGFLSIPSGEKVS